MLPILINAPVKLNINQRHCDLQNIPFKTAVALWLENLFGGQMHMNSLLRDNADWPLKEKMRCPFQS